MFNYKLIIEYEGSNFKGWQRQTYTSNTIQEQIESAIAKILKQKVSLIGAGRTDAGVSAYNQVANFRFPRKIEIKKFTYSLNSILPDSITIKRVALAKPDFHSRYSAIRREYIYKITTIRKSICRNEYYRINYSPDFNKVDEFVNFVLSLNSFKSFCKNKEDRKDFVCRIYEFGYREIKTRGEIIFKITANRFLHSMVRAIVGGALEMGKGKLILNDLKDKVKKGDKISVKFLPANALFLNKIYY